MIKKAGIEEMAPVIFNSADDIARLLYKNKDKIKDMEGNDTPQTIKKTKGRTKKLNKVASALLKVKANNY
jgi:hypothetical protein